LQTCIHVIDSSRYLALRNIFKEEIPMYRICLVAVTLSLTVFLPTLAPAQEITAAQRTACKTDYEKYCSNVTPGGGRIIACLSKESANLTAACKAALSAAQAK
jgi:hypothetical protein